MTDIQSNADRISFEAMIREISAQCLDLDIGELPDGTRRVLLTDASQGASWEYYGGSIIEALQAVFAEKRDSSAFSAGFHAAEAGIALSAFSGAGLSASQRSNFEKGFLASKESDAAALAGAA
ncbi:MAG: hypothetical protein WDN46_24985 [Methylocella sp.]